MTPYLMQRTKAKVILFSKSPDFSDESLNNNQIRVFMDDGWIKIQDGERLVNVIQVSDIPITCSGKIECNVENALAAASALYALKIPVDTIAEGLKTFQNNVGRFDLYTLNDFQVMLDYGHNYPGYQQVIRACKNIGFKRLVGVIGMPGDRTNDAIQSVGRLCSESFDQIYIKEDSDKRGREQREVAEIFYNSIVANKYDEKKVQIIENELEALKTAVENAKAGDLIVLLYEKLEPLQDYLALLKQNPKK